MVTNLWPFKKNLFDLGDDPPSVKYEGTNYIVDEFTPAEMRKELHDIRFTKETIDILKQDQIDGILGG
jgi:hypothetical protein